MPCGQKRNGTQGLTCKSGLKRCAAEKTPWLQPTVGVLVNPFVSVPVSISFIPNSDGLGKLQLENSIIDLKKSSKSFQKTAYFLGGNFLLSFPLPSFRSREKSAMKIIFIKTRLVGKQRSLKATYTGREVPLRAE